MQYEFKGYITDGEEKRPAWFRVQFENGGFQYGNGYYMGIKGGIQCSDDKVSKVDRLYDVRYEIIEDFKVYALNTIKSIWSGEKGSWKFIEG